MTEEQVEMIVNIIQVSWTFGPQAQVCAAAAICTVKRKRLGINAAIEPSSVSNRIHTVSK